MSNESLPGSFRDPSGFLFYQDNILYRQVNKSYQEDYDSLLQSGLYQALIDDGLLIPHKEVCLGNEGPGAYKTIQPEQIAFISYPYEWCFSQLKDAALLTLRIQKTALDHGMSLKDASAYNIQFQNGKPVFIDTLSFERYVEGNPWIAYRQFCQHFLAPLALMNFRDIRLSQMFRIYIDGIPLDLASSLLPRLTFLRFSLLSHIHLHAGSQKHFSDKALEKSGRKMSRFSLFALIDSLESAVKKLKWKNEKTEWGDYYDQTNYSADSLKQKKETVKRFIEELNPKSLWDLGANTGMFSRIAGDKGIPTVSFDIDPASVEKSYLESVKKGETHILPLLLDLTNPSSGLGWENEERMSFFERGPTDCALALALIHHLAISNNLPISRIAGFFSRICHALIIEFVPKSDSQVRRLLSTREDIFQDYKQGFFEDEFKRHFIIQDSVKIRDSERTLYLMCKKENKI